MNMAFLVVHTSNTYFQIWVKDSFPEIFLIFNISRFFSHIYLFK